MKAVAVFQGKLKESYCSFYQDSPNAPVKINGHIKHLPSGKHGFHVHHYGNLLKTDCSTCGGHWNPGNQDHGGLNDMNSHAGDLGNIIADVNLESTFHLKTSKLTLYGPNSIIGRSVVIHKDEDDCGKGGFADSLITGHAGARIDCAVIGYA
jgi:Cu-Zn family superoxide dismutase